MHGSAYAVRYQQPRPEAHTYPPSNTVGASLPRARKEGCKRIVRPPLTSVSGPRTSERSPPCPAGTDAARQYDLATTGPSHRPESWAGNRVRGLPGSLAVGKDQEEGRGRKYEDHDGHRSDPEIS